MTFIPIILIGLFILISAFFVVKQQTAAIIERFGKFHSIRQSGLQLKIPLVDRISGKLSLKIQQLDVIVETKTKDDVFVRLKVSVQYKVIRNKVADAFYKLDYPHDQITSYVFDVVRAEVPKMIFYVKYVVKTLGFCDLEAFTEKYQDLDEGNPNNGSIK